MINLVKAYIINLEMEDLDKAAKKNNIYFSESELLFAFHFIKNNYEEVINNKDAFNFNDYKEHFTSENFEKINELIKKYHKYL